VRLAASTGIIPRRCVCRRGLKDFFVPEGATRKILALRIPVYVGTGRYGFALMGHPLLPWPPEAIIDPCI